MTGIALLHRGSLARLGQGVAAVLLAACAVSGDPAPPQETTMSTALVPAPASLRTLGGALPLTAAAEIHSGDSEFEFWAAVLAAELRHFAPAARSTAKAGRVLLLRDPTLASEAYRLVIDEDVSLIAATPAGIGYATQTLRQLLAANARPGRLDLPRLVIEDEPRFGWRGMHLDVSRHFFSVEFVRAYIDLLALHKMNVLHWHLTDDQGWRIEIRAYPRLTEIGATRDGTVIGHTHDANAVSDRIEHSGHYTQDEIRDLVRYASARNVTIVPEIDVPGHASAIIAAYPEFGCGPETRVKTHFGIFKQILCPTEATFDFLDTLIGEVAEMFPGRYLHIGGDEVLTDHWEQCDRCRALMASESIVSLHGLQDYFFARTAALVRRHGKEPIGWDEILNEKGEASGTVMAWRGVERGLEAARHGHDVIMTPVSNTYFDFYQSTSLDEPMSIHGLTRLADVYAFEPVPAALEPDVRGHVLGGEGTLWTEYVATPEAAERQVLPRMSALSEVLWSPDAAQNFDDFVTRLETFGPYLEARGYTVSDAHLKPEISAERELAGFRISMDTARGTVHYTLDGSRPTQHSPVYSGPVAVPGTAVVRARTQTIAGAWFGESRLSVVSHAALDAKLSVAGLDRSQAQRAANVLLDGRLASDRIFHYDDWFALEERDLELTLEWLEPRSVSRVSVGIDAGLHRKLARPSAARVEVDAGDGTWATVDSLGRQRIIEADKRLEFRFEPTVVRRLRIVMENPGPAWSEEREADMPVTLRCDELIVL